MQTRKIKRARYEEKPFSTEQEQKKAAISIQRAYRSYLLKKKKLFPLPVHFYQNPPEIVTNSNANGRFLVENIKAEERFLVSKVGGESLIASLKSGNYSLLEFYLQKGVDPRRFIYETYFRNQDSEMVSLDLLDAICDARTAADELTGSNKPGNKVRCFSIMDAQGNWSQHAKNYFIPYLCTVFPITHPDIFFLQEKIKSIPITERFFVTVDYQEELQLAAFNLILEKCIDQILNKKVGISKNNIYTRLMLSTPFLTASNNPYKERFHEILKHLNHPDLSNYHYDVTSDLDTSHILSILYEIQSLFSEHPYYSFLDNENDNFHLQLIGSKTSITYPILSPNCEGVAQVLVPGKVIDICASLAYGNENSMTRFIGFGIFSARTIAHATKLNGRIINIQDDNIEGLKKAHGSKSGAWTIRIHDMVHMHRMNALPIGIRRGIISLAEAHAYETGFFLSKFSYRMYDMDFMGFEYLNKTNSNRVNIDYSFVYFEHFYENITDTPPEYKSILFEYHLLTIFKLLKDPTWMNLTFSHCRTDQPLENYLYNFLMRLNKSFYSVEINYENSITYYLEPCSITYSVFNYLISRSCNEGRLCWPAKVILLSAAHEIDIFKWTKDLGLMLAQENDDFFVRDINNDNFITILMLFISAANTYRSDFINFLKLNLEYFREHWPEKYIHTFEEVKKILDDFSPTKEEPPLMIFSINPHILFFNPDKKLKNQIANKVENPQQLYHLQVSTKL